MFFIYILSIMLGCSSSNVTSTSNATISGRIDNDLNIGMISTEVFVNLKHSHLMIGEKNKITVSPIDDVDMQIIEAASLSGNYIEITNDNELFITDTQGKRTDILALQLNYDGNEITQNFEIRFADESKVCLGIYLAGDNDLNGGSYSYVSGFDFVKNDLAELTQVTIDNDKLQIILLIDRNDISDDAYRGTILQDPGIFLIENGTVVKLRHMPEPNMGDPATLTFFLDAMNDYCKAQKYILDLWSHGFSIFGVGFDASHDNDSLDAQELKQGIEESKLGSLDVILFSACLMMDLGILGELKDCVGAITGSADSVPGNGSFYGNKKSRGLVGAIEDNADASNITLAEKMCEVNFNSYFNSNEHGSSGDIHKFLTYSAVDQTKAQNVMDALKNLLLEGDGLRANFDAIFTELVTKESVFYSCYDYYGTSHTGDIIDLGSLAYAISEYHNNNQLKSLATALLNTIKGINGYVTKALHVRTESEFNEDHIGLGIFYKPPTSSLGSYQMNNSEVYEYTGWNKLMGVN